MNNPISRLIWKWKDRKRRGKPYLLPLEDLIKLSESRMKVKPTCTQCGTEMTFRHSDLVVHVTPVRDDVMYKCTNCFHTIHFGNPLTREEALEEIRLRGNSRFLSRPTKRPDERDLEVIQERLRKLGYIE